jgi:phosphatidylglycerol:prolipoprotein diacylglycerol transferase
MDQFINFWQNLPAQIIPYLFSIGSFQLRYYSLMYIVAFALVYITVRYRIKDEKYEYKPEIIQDYMVWAMIGVIVGGRLGYALFYNFSYYWQHPLEIISILPMVLDSSDFPACLTMAAP